MIQVTHSLRHRDTGARELRGDRDAGAMEADARQPNSLEESAKESRCVWRQIDEPASAFINAPLYQIHNSRMNWHGEGLVSLGLAEMDVRTREVNVADWNSQFVDPAAVMNGDLEGVGHPCRLASELLADDYDLLIREGWLLAGRCLPEAHLPAGIAGREVESNCFAHNDAKRSDFNERRIVGDRLFATPEVLSDPPRHVFPTMLEREKSRMGDLFFGEEFFHAAPRVPGAFDRQQRSRSPGQISLDPFSPCFFSINPLPLPLAVLHHQVAGLSGLRADAPTERSCLPFPLSVQWIPKLDIPERRSGDLDQGCHGVIVVDQGGHESSESNFL